MASSLGSFFDAMLTLRSQRMREQEQKEQAMAGMGEAIAGGVSSLGKGLTQGMEKQRTNELANKLGGDPNAPWQGGGAQEIELRKAMGQYSDNRGDDAWKAQKQQMELNRYYGTDPATQDRLERARTAKQQADASKALQDSDKKFQAAYKNSLAYQKSASHLLESITKATTMDEYQPLAQQLRALNDANRDVGLSTALVSTPPFISPDQKTALAERETTRQAMLTGGQSITPGTVWGQNQSPQAQAFGQAQQAVEQSGLPPQMGPGGVPQYGQAPMEQPAGPQGPAAQRLTPEQAQAQAQGGGNVPIVGRTYRNPTTGERRVFTANGWVTIK